jgi:hypothetical protein
MSLRSTLRAALRSVYLPSVGSQFKRASPSPRLVPSTTMTSADFPPPEGGGISPGKSTLLRRTAAAFTSRGIPDAFGVLCHLDAPCRRCRAAPALRAAFRLAVSAFGSGSMRFLFIGSRLSPSLPSPSWLPFPSWPQMVVFHIFMISGISTGDFNPIYNVPMLGTHKSVVDNRLPALSRNDPLDYNP